MYTACRSLFSEVSHDLANGVRKRALSCAGSPFILLTLAYHPAAPYLNRRCEKDRNAQTTITGR